MGAVVNVYYGPPSHPRLEGKAEIVEVIRYVDEGLYKVKVHFLGDPPECTHVREVDVKDVEGGDAKS